MPHITGTTFFAYFKVLVFCMCVLILVGFSSFFKHLNVAYLDNHTEPLLSDSSLLCFISVSLKSIVHIISLAMVL